MRPRIKRICGLAAIGLIAAASSGCEEDQIRAVVAGIEAAAQTLSESSDDDQDVSFGDWLAMELED